MQLDLRHERHGLHAVELLAERERLVVARKHRVLPRLDARREIARLLVEAHLNLRPGEKLDELPRFGRMLRLVEEHETRAAGGRQPALGAGRAGKRRGRPVVLQLVRQAASELADVPRTGDVEGEEPALELLEDVRDVGVSENRREPVAIQPEVELEGAHELGVGERAPSSAVLEERRARLHPENRRLRPFVGGKEDRPLVGAERALHVLHRASPIGPRRRHLAPPRAREQILSIEEDARVHVPGNAVDGVVDDVGCPDPGKESLAADDAATARPAPPAPSAPSAPANSGIHVLPNCATSGVDLPTCAVSSFSCAALHGICWTRTRMPGCSRSNCGTSFATCSPSAPIAQNRIVTSRAPSARPHAVHTAARRTA